MLECGFKAIDPILHQRRRHVPCCTTTKDQTESTFSCSICVILLRIFGMCPYSYITPGTQSLLYDTFRYKINYANHF